jgi:hypothetical protein
MKHSTPPPAPEQERERERLRRLIRRLLLLEYWRERSNF